MDFKPSRKAKLGEAVKKLITPPSPSDPPDSPRPHTSSGKSCFGHLTSSGCPRADGKRDPSQGNDSALWVEVALRGPRCFLRCHPAPGLLPAEVPAEGTCNPAPLRPAHPPVGMGGCRSPLHRVDIVNEVTRANCPEYIYIFFNNKNFHNVHNTINISY